MSRSGDVSREGPRGSLDASIGILQRLNCSILIALLHAGKAKPIFLNILKGGYMFENICIFLLSLILFCMLFQIYLYWVSYVMSKELRQTQKEKREKEYKKYVKSH